MQTFKKLHLLHSLLIFSFFFKTSISQQTPTSFCGKIQIQSPFLVTNSTLSSPLNQMILCKSQKLYFRTSVGLFPISFIDYKTKTLIISHSFCSSTTHYVSPSLFSAGFPSPTQSNSILLSNCSNQSHTNLPFIRNSTCLKPCGVFSPIQEQKVGVPYSCLLVNDLDKLDMGFHPKDLNCSHYSRIYRKSSDDGEYEGVELGTRISFDIPDHAPDLCNECRKPNGNCGVGLKCICHPQECRDKVISFGRYLSPVGNMFFSLLSFILVMVFSFHSSLKWI